ncbi:hypothetical protein GOC28_08390 [Sinorhizobium meliloti]|nr:hypothetical protein [Sinorhizobium meliloti]MDX0093472.1 hypothetical protein [Sinorhizobium meliloti]
MTPPSNDAWHTACVQILWASGETYNLFYKIKEIAEAIDLEKQQDAIDRCPICNEPFKADDICATDIELMTCHVACLEGSPVVDLDSGEPLPEGKMHTYRYGDDNPPPHANAHGPTYLDFITPDDVFDKGPDAVKAWQGAKSAEITNPPPQQRVPCPCTLIEQDDDCPVGYPSMLCGVCKGTGNTTPGMVSALACEMIKIASDMGEPDDPFAAWESIDLVKSQRDQLRKALADMVPPKLTWKERDADGFLVHHQVAAINAARAALAATEASPSPPSREAGR